MKPDKTSSIPLYIQIREDLRRTIATGTLKPGERLPPVTTLAEQKEVTAATIRRALQDLTDEGLITAHVGRGTFITEPGIQNKKSDKITTTPRIDEGKQDSPTEKTKRPPMESQDAVRRLRQSVTRSLNEMMGIAHRPGIIAFTRGIAAPETIEKGILTRLTQEALREGEEIFWDYGDPRGLLSLRKAIVNLYREQGISITPDQILITNGSQQAVSLIAQQAAENGTPVICETPCYTGVTNALSAFGLQIETVVRDEEGPAIEKLPVSVDLNGSLFYLCPVIHNPMGTNITPEKQKKIIDWAKENRVTILADEVFRDLNTDAPLPKSFLHEPGPDHAIILGSLSKSFISGLRVGWIITSEERIRVFTQIKKSIDLGCPPLMQGIARVFLEDPTGYCAHRERIRNHYRNLRDCTIAALEQYMPNEVSWTKPQGGFQLWVTMPRGFSSVELFLRSVEKGVAFLPGPLQDINNRFMNSFRLCYGSLSVVEIKTGIERLAQALKEYLNESPRETGIGGLGDY